MIKNKKGFTLIELIIVMAIIGILAVVAVVAIGSKSEDARDARRLADMSAVRTALALHCAEPTGLSLGTVGSTDTDIHIKLGAAGLVEVKDVNDDITTYIAFSTIIDPSGSTTPCASGASTQCNYAFGDPISGGNLASGAYISACDYRINFYQEGDGVGYAADEGLVE